MNTYLDLTAPLNNDTPVYPGDPPVRVTAGAQVAKDGYADSTVTFSTHSGTHIDAPMHMLESGKSLGAYGVKDFIGRGVLIDVRDGDFSKVTNANIAEGDIVLFWTDRTTDYHQQSYFESYPTMQADIAEYLVEKQIKMVGFDACSPDENEDFPNHKTLLAGSVLILENLTNLQDLEGKEFTVYALPLKLDVDGAPVRVVAEIQS